MNVDERISLTRSILSLKSSNPPCNTGMDERETMQTAASKNCKVYVNSTVGDLFRFVD